MEKEVNEVEEVREVEDATGAWCGSRRRNAKRGLATETQRRWKR